MAEFVWLKLFKAAIAQKLSGDIALGAAGIALAGSSVAFAGYMIATSDQAPRINAADKLAIFAQPVSVPYNMGFPRKSHAPEYDMTPVGTVRTRTGSAAPVEKGVPNYHIRGYSQGEALVQGPDGFVNVKVGAEIEGLGRVTAIEVRGRNLVVITTGGLIAGDE